MKAVLITPIPLLCLVLLTACPPIKDSSEPRPREAGAAVAPSVPVGQAAKKPSHRVARAAVGKIKAEVVPDPGLAASTNPNTRAAPSLAEPGSWPLTPKRDPAHPADANKKPLDIQALYKIPTVSGPRWSPDGARLLFVVSRHELTGGKSNDEIYRVDADGKNLRRMTRNEASDVHPRWAPDGKSFLFVSTRKDGAQVWRMPADGGEPEQLTHLSTKVSAPAWTPDGKGIVLISRIFPEAGADDAANKALAEARKESAIQAHLADDLLYRHWTSYRDGRRNHLLLYDIAKKAYTDLTPGDFDSPSFHQGSGGFDLSPHGEELCFVSNRQGPGAQSWTTNKDLWLVPTTGGVAVNLTAGNAGFDGHPGYSPDGRHIAYLRQSTPGYEADRFELLLYDRVTKKTRALTDGFDNWVLDFHWSSDSKAIIFNAPIKGRFPLLRVEVATGKIRRLGVPMARGFDVAPDGQVAFIDTAVDRPTELYLADRQGNKPRRITRMSEQITREYDLRPATEMWLPGAGGRKVHTFVVTPHGFKPGKRYPLIINVHGGPQYQWSDMLRGDWQVYPAAGYVVAFFNPHGSIGYGQAYTAAISKDWGGKVYEDVIKVTEALAKLEYVDPERMGAMGWSYGGYMMNWLLGQPHKFKALVSMMGLYDLPSFYGATEELWFPEWDLGGTPWGNPGSYSKWSPSARAAKFKTPTLVITGEKDYRVPYTQSLQLFTALRRQKVPARLIVFPDDGHWPSYVKSMPLYYAAHLDWFAKYLGGGGSPWKIEDMVRGKAFK